MERILILTSASGSGHNQVAQALRQALIDEGGETVRAVIVDPFQGADFPSRMTRLYGPAIVNASWLWGMLYHMTDNVKWAMALASPLERAVALALERENPDLVVSVHPLCHGAALRALKRMGREVPVAVLITDLMDVHVAWQDPGVSLFLAPTMAVADQLTSRGFPARRVHCMGLPVHAGFRDAVAQADCVREQLGLDRERPAILVTGGGEGAGPLERAARVAVRALPRAQVVMACGRNESLRRRLVAAELPGKILGFVENMAHWMKACDIVVAKAGALTVAEATASRRPLVVMDALPGQERGNLKYVLESGIGVHAPPDLPLAMALRALEAQAFRPRAWLENMARIDQPQASELTARLLLERVRSND